MKLHIEVLQEKVDGLNKEKDSHKKELEKIKNDNQEQIDKFNKVIKTLEEELTNKVDKIKEQERNLQETQE